MWPERLMDPDGREVEFVRRYGNHAEYRLEDGRTVWLSHNAVGAICYGQAIYREVQMQPRRCSNC